MVSANLLHTLQHLPRADKLYVMQFLVSALAQEEGELLNPTASFNSLPNVLVRKSAVTARSWLTEGTLRWSWTSRPPSPQVLKLLVVKLRSENNYLLQKLFL